jgi:hypothetical protein
MKYTINIDELIKRPIIRDDQRHESLNKMSDEEIKQFEYEVEQSLIEEGVVQKFPDWNAAFLAKMIDREILYTIFKEQ